MFLFLLICEGDVRNVPDYQPPYYDKLHQDPSFEDVKKVVCDEKYRPQIPKQWYNDEVNI